MQTFFRALFIIGVVVFCGFSCSSQAQNRPNILWLTSEDHGPQMGCYGDSYANTTNVDALAKKGLRYRFCWSNAPVCAPARTTLISGIYPTALGAENMRSMVKMPRGTQMYPQILRAAGYYCTNNAKTDYNLEESGQVWDASSGRAHWKNRPAGKPFFAIFNSNKSHESQLRARNVQLIHDPNKVRVPAYHPDTPEVRRDWARYYDMVSEADADAGEHLKELADAGLADDTIVFYYADHGSGMPRSKRWPYNSGLQVPLVVYIPEKYKDLRPPEYEAGGVSNRLVSFVDFAPTLLSLAGIAPPNWMQGHAFLGKFIDPKQQYVFGFRGRMDERPDCVRTISDGRYVYIRNFRPDLIYGQHINYMWQTPTTRIWEAMFKEGKLNAAQSAFWQTKPIEEFYDLQTDPDEVNNLVADPEYTAILNKMRDALHLHQLKIRDVGLLPEGEVNRRSVNSTPYDMAHDAAFSMNLICAMAEFAASRFSPSSQKFLFDRQIELKIFRNGLADTDSGVRYWAVLGLQMRGELMVNEARTDLTKLLVDESPSVKIAAAEALGKFGSDADLPRVLPLLGQLANWKNNDVFTVMAALNAIGALDQKAAPLKETINALPDDGPAPHARYKEYPPRLLEELKAKW